MLERDIESRSRKRAETKGWRMMKFISPGHAFVPDDIVMAPIPLWLQPVIAGYFRFIEFKRTGAKPTEPQKREHERRSFKVIFRRLRFGQPTRGLAHG